MRKERVSKKWDPVCVQCVCHTHIRTQSTLHIRSY